jgi:hypothetical protein
VHHVHRSAVHHVHPYYIYIKKEGGVAPSHHPPFKKLKIKKRGAGKPLPPLEGGSSQPTARRAHGRGF